MSETANPYQPPEAAISHPAASHAPAARRPRWHLLRWLPAVACTLASLIPGAYGALGCWQVAPYVFRKLIEGRAPLGPLVMLGFGVLYLAMGAWMLSAARDWARHRWMRAGVATVGVIVLFPLSLWALISSTVSHFVTTHQ